MYLTHFSFRIEHTDKKVHYIKTATKTPSSLHCSHLASMQYGLICIHFHNIVDFLFLSVLRLNSYLVMYLVKWNVFLWTIIHFLTVLFIKKQSKFFLLEFQVIQVVQVISKFSIASWLSRKPFLSLLSGAHIVCKYSRTLSPSCNSLI